MKCTNRLCVSVYICMCIYMCVCVVVYEEAVRELETVCVCVCE